MTNSVTVNGNTYNDGTTAPGNMGNGGHRDNLIPMLSDAVIDLAEKAELAATNGAEQVALAAAQAENALEQAGIALAQAQAAAASAASAAGAPGTNATSTTSMTIGVGVKTPTIQIGKLFSVGQQVVLAATASPTNWMSGTLTAHNSATGATSVMVTNIGSGSAGTFAAWTMSLSGAPAVTGLLNESLGASIASAATIDLSTPTGNLVHVTGSAPIAAITIPVGAERTIIFDGAPPLTHGAALLLPGMANITAAAGDRMIVRGDTSGANVIDYIRANGAPVVAGGIVVASDAGGTLLSYAMNAMQSAAAYTMPDLTTCGPSFGIAALSNAAAVPASVATSDGWSIATGFVAGTLRMLAAAAKATAHGVWPGSVMTPPQTASFAGSSTNTLIGTVNLTATLGVVSWRDTSLVYVAAVNLTTGAMGAPVSFSGVGGSAFNYSIFADSATTFVLNYSNGQKLVAGSVSGLSITLGAPVTVGMGTGLDTMLQLAPGTYLLVGVVTVTNDLFVATVSGTTITVGGGTLTSGVSGTAGPRFERINSTQALITYPTGGAPHGLAFKVATITGTSAALGAAVNTATSVSNAGASSLALRAFAPGGPFLACVPNSTTGASGNWYGITVSGTVPTIGTVSTQANNVISQATAARQTFAYQPKQTLLPYDGTTMLLGTPTTGVAAVGISGTTLTFGSTLALGASQFVTDLDTGANFYAIGAATVDKLSVSGTTITSSYQLAVSPTIIKSDTLNDKAVKYGATWYAWTLTGGATRCAISPTSWLFSNGFNFTLNGPIS